jgi:hypothetical protein
MFNLPFSVIFFDTVYKSHTYDDYLFEIVFNYLESFCFFGMRVYKYLELNPFDNIMDMFLGDLQYAKLNVNCFAKCDEFFCNKVKTRFINEMK